MAGSNPTVTATITAVDNATGTIKSVAELSTKVSKETNAEIAASAVAMQRNVNAAQSSVALPVVAAAGLGYALVKLRDPSKQLGGANAEDYTAPDMPFAPDVAKAPPVIAPPVAPAPAAPAPVALSPLVTTERHGGGGERLGDFAAAVEMERETRLRLPPISEPTNAPVGDANHNLAAAIEGLRASLTTTPTKVEGEVKGEATLVSTIKVEPSPMLTTIVTAAQGVVKMGLEGKMGTTMSGSNAAKQSVAPGLSMFKTSVSGR